MNKRPVDKTKKSNIKCEHCEHWNHVKSWDCFCEKDRSHKANYWNRCKEFEWSTDNEYKEVEAGNDNN